MLARFKPVNLFATSLNELPSEIDRLFNDFRSVPTFRCSLDVREDEGHIYIDADVPGFGKDDISITIEDDVLVVSGEKKEEHKVEDGDFHLRERRSGAFERRLQLPSTVDPSRVRANLKDGVLTVTLDKREEMKPRTIDVSVE